MTLGNIKIEGKVAGFVMLLAIAGCFVISFCFAKWCFANAVSTRTNDKDVAELAMLLGPDDPQTHYAAAVIYEKSFDPKDLNRSLAEYEQVAALSPNNYLAWLELAGARDRSGDPGAAGAAYIRSLDLAPHYADVQWAYGNSLIRQARIDEGFALIRAAALAKPSLIPASVTTALAYSDGDLTRVSALLGTSSPVSLAIAKFAASKNDFEQAVRFSELIPRDDSLDVYREEIRALAARMVEARRFRLAARLTKDISEDGKAVPEVGAITDGGFETIDLGNTNIFDWQIGGGPGQVIGLNSERRIEGQFSLFMLFNTTQLPDFRPVTQTVAVVPGTGYLLTGNSISELKGGVAWDIADASDGKSLARTPAIVTSGDWVSFQAKFTVPQTTDGIIVRLVRDGCTSAVCPITGKVWFDNLKLTVQ